MESRSAILSEWSSLKWPSAQAENRSRSCQPFNSANLVRIACAATETQARGIKRPVRSSPNPTRRVGKRKRIPTGNRFLILHRSWRTTLAWRVETRLISTFEFRNILEDKRRDESRRGTHECVRYVSVRMACEKCWLALLRFVYDNGAGLHHPAHFVDGDLNVVQRV